MILWAGPGAGVGNELGHRDDERIGHGLRIAPTRGDAAREHARQYRRDRQLAAVAAHDLQQHDAVMPKPSWSTKQNRRSICRRLMSAILASPSPVSEHAAVCGSP